MHQTRESAISTSIRLRREIKQYFSSDFEILLLKLTRPDDNRPVDADVDRFLNTIEDFVRDLDTTNPSNPYRVTLHKLWNKAAEDNGYTVLKALFLLHTLLRYTQPEDAVIFKSVLFKMVRERDRKHTGGSKYFNADRIAKVSPETKHLSSFISRYTTYLLKRGRTFTASFEEMKLLHAGSGLRPEDVTAQLLKAIKVLDAALQCRAGQDEECAVSMSCLELVARDVRELFLLLHSKLRFVVQEQATGNLFSDWPEAEVRAVLQHLKSYYNDRFEDIEGFLADVAEVLQLLYGINLPSQLSTPQIFDDPASASLGHQSQGQGQSEGEGGVGGGGGSGARERARERERETDAELEVSGESSLSAFLSGPRRPEGPGLGSDLGAMSDGAGPQPKQSQLLDEGVLTRRRLGSASSADTAAAGAARASARAQTQGDREGQVASEANKSGLGGSESSAWGREGEGEGEGEWSWDLPPPPSSQPNAQ